VTSLRQSRAPGSLQGPDLRAKIAFLSRPESYPDRTAGVEVVHTHMSCVFLTDRHAWKLKKPVRHDFLDFSTLEARRRDCEEELRLNRRLARDVYLEIVPLVAARNGALRLGGAAAGAVEWLLKMRRLPRRLMLDHAMRGGRVDRADVRRFALVLAAFYRAAQPVPTAPEAYRAGLAEGVRAAARELLAYGLPHERVRAATADALAALAELAPELDRRVAQGRIVDGHGDLRPEHVCLGPEPLFIDCLEFKRDWRLVDPADELAYLGMECELAGAGWIGEIALDTYSEATGDKVSVALVHAYKACRASLRAKLSAWHLKDVHEPAEREMWIARAARYLDLAAGHAAAARG
jgi:aminoglycoside phosphotransferase family enzyme